MEKEAGRRGVVTQAVKDVVQSLVDDDLVHVDKVGTTNWYWAFPGEATSKAHADAEAATTKREALIEEKRLIEQKIAKEKKQNPITTEHEDANASLITLKELRDKLKMELETYSSSNPETITAMRNGAQTSKRAADVWTDNIFMMKSWAEQKMGDRDSIKQFFKSEGVDLDTLDYV